jgi:hypothetical protein
MKNVLKFIFIATLFCLFLSVPSGGIFDSQFSTTISANSENKKPFFIDQHDLIGHALHFQNTVNLLKQITAGSFKNKIQDFCLYFKARENYFFSRFSNYFTYSQNDIFRFEKTDIIFPFHNFW